MATGAAAPARPLTVEAKNPSAPVIAVVASQSSSKSVAAPVTNPLSGPSDSERVAAARAAIQPPKKKATSKLKPPQIPAAVPQVCGSSSPPRALMPSAMPSTVKNKRTANAVTTPAIIGPQRIRSRIGTSATSTSTAGTPITPVATVDGGNPVESILPEADDSAARFPRGSVFIHFPSACQLRWPRRTTQRFCGLRVRRLLPSSPEPRVKRQTSYANTLALSAPSRLALTSDKSLRCNDSALTEPA